MILSTYFLFFPLLLLRVRATPVYNVPDILLLSFWVLRDCSRQLVISIILLLYPGIQAIYGPMEALESMLR